MISLFVAQIYANKSYVRIKIKKKEYFLTYLSHTLRNSVQKSPPHHPVPPLTLQSKQLLHLKNLYSANA